MDPKELAAALRLRLRLDPPIKRGVPKLLFNQFIKRTARWLAEGSPIYDLPLSSLGSLRKAIAEFQSKGRMPTNRRSATDPVRRTAQISETVTSALTRLTARLRDHPSARKEESGSNAILLSFEISLGQDVFAAEVTGLLPKNRDGLGFPEDERIGLLARLKKRDRQPISATSSDECERADIPAIQSVSQKPEPGSVEVALKPFLEHSQLLSAVLDLSSRLSERTSKAQPPRSPRELPQPPRDFTSRDQEISEILDAIRTRRFTIVGLQGPGGIGKTALALSLAAKLSLDYESSIFLDLKGNAIRPLTPSEVMRHVLLAHYPGRPLPDSFEDLSGLYHSLLHEKPALLLFDNARDAVQLQPLIPPATSLLLVTSIPRFSVPGMHRKQLDPFQSDAANAMLVAIAPRCAPEAETIATLCGRFPLALRAAGHAMAEMPSISPAAFAARLHDTRKRLELVDPTTDRSIEAVLDLSYALLSPLLQERFNSLAVFPATFDSAAAGAIWRLGADQTLDALAMLIKFSFVEYDEADDRYHLHVLLRLFADAHLWPSVRNRLDCRFARHVRTVLYAQPWISEDDAIPRDARHRLVIEWPNIRQVYRWAMAKPERDASAARFLATFQWIRTLVARWIAPACFIG
jgi:hypothetical protein